MTKPGKSDIKSLQLEELQEILRPWGERSFRAEQITNWLYKKRSESISQMTDLPFQLRDKLTAELDCYQLETIRVLDRKSVV